MTTQPSATVDPSEKGSADPAPVPAPTRRDRLARWRHWTCGALIANLAGQIAIVLSGGLVRLTGSGLGCSTWPQCEPGHFTPQYHEAISIHPYIEFGNRLVSVVLVVIAIVVALLVCSAPGRGRATRAWGLVPVVGVVIQGVVGGITVLIDLHPAIVGSHLLLSMLLVSLSTYLLVRWDRGEGPTEPVIAGWRHGLIWFIGLWTVPILVLGVVVTGSGPHSGDTTVGYRFGFDPVAVTRLHSFSVWVLVIALTVATLTLVRERARLGGLWPALTTMVCLTLLQGVIGYAQYFSDLPVTLVAMHMLAAALVAAAATWVVLAARRTGALAVTADVG